MENGPCQFSKISAIIIIFYRKYNISKTQLIFTETEKVIRYLQNLYSKINFKVFYFTQFSIFLKINKNIRYILFIATLQLLGLVFFDSMKKLLTIIL